VPPPLSALRASIFSPWGLAKGIESPKLLLNKGPSEPCYATDYQCGWLVALSAEFDKCLDAPVLMLSVIYYIKGLYYQPVTTTCCSKNHTFIIIHHYWHIRADLAGPGVVRLLNRSGPVFCGSFQLYWPLTGGISQWPVTQLYIDWYLGCAMQFVRQQCS